MWSGERGPTECIFTQVWPLLFACDIPYTAFICALGVYLEYFGGESPEGEPDPVRYSTRVYILCQQGTEFTKPELEHIKSFYQVHLRMYSKYACA